ncbi:MAG: hypothetical protein ABI378_01965 [Chitinophagaceae bacterium]
MAQNFSTKIPFDGKNLLAIVIPALRNNGMHYEVNIVGFPRFWLRWGVSDRFELASHSGKGVPDALVLAVSDEIEKRI